MTDIKLKFASWTMMLRLCFCFCMFIAICSSQSASTTPTDIEKELSKESATSSAPFVNVDNMETTTNDNNIQNGLPSTEKPEISYLHTTNKDAVNLSSDDDENVKLKLKSAKKKFHLSMDTSVKDTSEKSVSEKDMSISGTEKVTLFESNDNTNLLDSDSAKSGSSVELTTNSLKEEFIKDQNFHTTTLTPESSSPHADVVTDVTLSQEERGRKETIENRQLMFRTTEGDTISSDTTMDQNTSISAGTTKVTLENIPMSSQMSVNMEKTMEQEEKSPDGQEGRNIDQSSVMPNTEMSIEISTHHGPHTSVKVFDEVMTVDTVDSAQKVKDVPAIQSTSANHNLSNSLFDENQKQVSTKVAEYSTTTEIITENDDSSRKESDITHVSSDRNPKQLNVEERMCPCDVSKSSFDPQQCFGLRTVPDPNCPCRRMCAKQTGEFCNETSICDEEFGLHCNQESNTCKGLITIHIFDVTHNSAKVKWSSDKTESNRQSSLSYTTAYRGNYTQWTKVEAPQTITALEILVPNTYYYVKVEEDGKQEIGIFKTKEGCIFNATLSYAVGEKFNLSCNQTCTCYAGGEPECHDRCYYIPTDVPHPSCIKVPDESDPCCVRLQCSDGIAGNPPKVLMTQHTPSTFTVVWDDFRLPSHHSEYILEYRLANIENETWTKVQAGSQPIVTVTHLKPNTAYQVRVAVWEDGNVKLELPSEIVTVHTQDGCMKDNKTYAVGEEFFHGCDLRCICEGSDQESCNPRCNSPYIKVGSKPDDPLCYEKPLPSDPCCVIVRCTEAKSLDVTEAKGAAVNKPGECPEILEESHSAANFCLYDCDHDGDCNGSLKCCPSSCGGAVCVQPLVDTNICENIHCGPNAKCIADKMACECVEGYEGNPHDFLNGCKLGSDSKKKINSTVEFAPNTSDNIDQKSDVKTTTMPESSTVAVSETVDKNEVEKNAKEYDLDSATEAPFELDLASKSFEEPDIIPEKISTDIDEINSLVTTMGPHPIGEIKPKMHQLDDTKARSHNTHEEDDVTNITEDEKYKNVKESDKKLPADVPEFFDGCEYNNITYDRGVRFEDGCEARCICDGAGHVSCVPRCSILSSGGSNCKEIPDPDDSCCKIMVCNFPGSGEMERAEDLSLKILSAQPQNGTAVRIRLALSSSNLPTKVGQETLEIYFRIMSDDSNLSQWNKRPVLLKELTEVQQNVFEFDVGGLLPDTDYYFKVAKESQGTTKLPMAEFSNTVNAKTFPAVVKSVFQGCFHHNQTYNLGETFYQGCELKCVCREKGFIECQDRCDIYIDTVGYEGCDWVPSEEDQCCMVPSCQRRKIPLLPDSRLPPFMGPLENMCVVNSNEVYRVGDMWELDDGCKMKICRCSMLANGSTTIQCQSECPSLPPNAHIPTARCPHPVLIKPDGPCTCPYISCNEPPRRVIPPPRPQCEYKGKRYDMGQEFHDGCVALCHCGQDLRVNCAGIECPYHFSAEYTNCLEWDIDPDFFPAPPHCCAPSKCKNDGSCTFSGQKFSNFEDIPADLLPCGTRCICVNGNVTCENRCPSVEDVPPANLPCQPSLAYKAHPPGETCCLQWMCRELPKQSYCLFQGTRYLPNEQWEVRKGSQRRLCSCDVGPSGTLQVECKGGCPQIPQRFLLPSEQCALPVIVTPDDPVMCPYVVCNNTVAAQELYNVNVVALNSTAVRIRFTLSNILVGLVGHAELHFTTDPTLPPSEWHIQKFSRPKRLFDSPNIEYILNALRPNTTYFLQVKIKIDALQGGPESEVFKLRMPEDTVVTTTTTTLPPVIMIDSKPEAHVIDATTARISWRNFEPQEKKFIYAVQLKYKLENEADDKWITTPMIHRDVTSYFLHDLKPSSSYVVDMIFTAPKDISTKLVSAKSLDLHTPGKPKDDYNLQVYVDENKVDANTMELKLSGIPDPISKYVHVVKILYKTPNGKESYSFKVPKSNHVELDHLEPGKKYLAQMELYLTNGHTLMSNEVEFITKDVKPSANLSVKENTISDTHTNGKQAELLQSKEVKDDENHAYFIALVVVAVVAAVAGFGFILLLVILVKRQASAKAPISRTPSESAYDNPTYKTYDGERLEEKTNGQAIQTTQA